MNYHGNKIVEILMRFRLHKLSHASDNNKLDFLKHDTLISVLKFCHVTPAILPSLYFSDARLK